MIFPKRIANTLLIFILGITFIPLFQNCSSPSFEANLGSSSPSNGLDEGSGMGNDHSSEHPPGEGPPELPPPVLVGGIVTDLGIENTSASELIDVPLTFGQVFPKGALSPSETLAGELSDKTPLNLQVENKATYPDGSLRHAVISAVIPKLAPNQKETLKLLKAAKSSDAAAAMASPPTNDNGFSTTINLNLDGTAYSASPDADLKTGNYKTWLKGPLTNEYLVSVPLKNTAGAEHPHLMARFAIRSFTGLNKARIEVTIENNWAYEAEPRNFTYDVQILIGGNPVYTKTALTHFHHARWRKIFWRGAAPQIHIKHNTSYLIASKAVSNYDQSLTISPTALDTLVTQWKSKDIGPMGTGIVQGVMQGVGGRPDIGPLPAWAAMYLLSMDNRAKEITLGVGDLAGGWPVHYRDKKTDRPVSLEDYPYIRTYSVGGDSVNPATKKNEAMPRCESPAPCDTGSLQPDSAHQPSMAYLPYIVTGDFFYLEELQFWANWNMIQANPYYREFGKGLVKWEQVRGQAWSLRTLGHAAFITPDNDPLKKYFNDRVLDNINWYNTAFAPGNRNALGVYDRGMDFALPDSGGPAIQPWMDDFLTWSFGYLVELGFPTAQPFFEWKSKFPVGRMTDPGYCWIDGAVYILTVRPGAGQPMYPSLAAAYQASFQTGKIRNEDSNFLVHPTGAVYLDQPCGSQAQADWRTAATGRTWPLGMMTGYSTSTHGYPSNMQPALAVAATSGIPDAQNAWTVFKNRTFKPDYSKSPQFAIVPR